jgi:hypothetical protein
VLIPPLLLLTPVLGATPSAPQRPHLQPPGHPPPGPLVPAPRPHLAFLPLGAHCKHRERLELLMARLRLMPLTALELPQVTRSRSAVASLLGDSLEQRRAQRWGARSRGRLAWRSVDI